MRTSPMVNVFVVALVVVAGCADDGGRGAPTTGAGASSPSTPATTPTTIAPTTSSVPATMPATTGSTMATVPGSSPTTVPVLPDSLLRATGVGSVRFGEPAASAIPALAALLGPPDQVDLIGPDDVCSPDTEWIRCGCPPGAVRVCTRVVREGRVVTWTPLGLTVVFPDFRLWNKEGPIEEPSLPFAMWFVAQPAEGPALAFDGIAPGMTVAEVRRLSPGVRFWARETTSTELQCGLDGRAANIPSVALGCELDWSRRELDGESWYMMEVQRALNAHGAKLQVDGVLGPKTQQAWEDFCRATSTDCWPDVSDTPAGAIMLEALGHPPADAHLVALWWGA